MRESSLHLSGKDASFYGKHHTKAVRNKMSLAKQGKKHNQWKGGRTDSKGYIMIFQPNHPHALNGRYVREHRLVYEAHLNGVSLEMWLRIVDEKIYPADSRFLTRKEIIHHINGIRTDNRLENLELTDKKNHKNYLICSKCGHKIFQR